MRAIDLRKAGVKPMVEHIRAATFTQVDTEAWDYVYAIVFMEASARISFVNDVKAWLDALPFRVLGI